MKEFPETYYFVAQDNSDKIILQVGLNSLFSILGVFTKETDTAEFKLVRDESFPCIQITSHINTDTNANYQTELPIILIASRKHPLYTIPTNLEFDTTLKTPRFLIFRKYLEIHKPYKYIHVSLLKDVLSLFSIDIDTKVLTDFAGTESFDVALPKRKIDVCVETKKILGYMISLMLLCAIDIPEMFVSLAHRKMLQIYFKNTEKTINFTCVIACVEDDFYEYERNEETSDSE